MEGLRDFSPTNMDGAKGWGERIVQRERVREKEWSGGCGERGCRRGVREEKWGEGLGKRSL